MISLLGNSERLSSQTIHVNQKVGSDLSKGSEKQPFKTLEHAVDHMNSLTGSGNLTIVVHPGFYTLSDKLAINPVRIMTDTTSFTLTAAIMPDDKEWSPQKMPVIQSTSTSNSETQFPHATGILVETENVNLQGLKFLGKLIQM